MNETADATAVQRQITGEKHGGGSGEDFSSESVQFVAGKLQVEFFQCCAVLQN